jgi:hypothetical protein
MTDMELLELAARAAGIKWDHEECGTLYLLDPLQPWNPLTDDGDALRLAVKLKINIEHVETLSRSPHGINCWPVGRGDCGAMEHDLSDYAAAVRRAIVRASAALANPNAGQD